MAKRKRGRLNTYDDVFRTLINDCRNLLLLLLNEMFGAHYRGDEEVIFASDTHQLRRRKGRTSRRITDSEFWVSGNLYHIECQSTPDGRILCRVFEYDAQIALTHSEIVNNKLIVKFPRTALLYLRSTRNTPGSMEVVIKTPGGDCRYTVPVMKVQDYSLDDIFNKRLLFLIPFYIFNHERELRRCEEDPSQLAALTNEFRNIRNRLEQMALDGASDEFTNWTLFNMTNNVAARLAERYDKVAEEVDEIMGGRILEYEAKTILRRGERRGKSETIVENLRSLMDNAKWTVEQAMEMLSVPVRERPKYAKLLAAGA